MEVSPLIGNTYTRNSNMGSKSPVGFQNMRSDLKFGAPSGEIGMTSLAVIETRPISPKPLQIGFSFLLTTNWKSVFNTANRRLCHFSTWPLTCNNVMYTA